MAGWFQRSSPGGGVSEIRSGTIGRDIGRVVVRRARIIRPHVPHSRRWRSWASVCLCAPILVRQSAAAGEESSRDVQDGTTADQVCRKNRVRSVRDQKLPPGNSCFPGCLQSADGRQLWTDSQRLKVNIVGASFNVPVSGIECH